MHGNQLDALTTVAFYDTLTVLPHRNLVNEHQRRPKVSRSGRAFALLYIDIDRLQQVNHALGRAAGDELLCQVAARLMHSLRSSDSVVRWRGDEFVVLLDGVSEPQLVARVARKLLSACSNPFALDAATYCITVSIGISCYPSDAGDIATLVQCAEQAMRAAKIRYTRPASKEPDHREASGT